jgi:bifunctional non-homologous end joining protein LigD
MGMELVAEHVVKISRPEKVLWPESGFRKIDLIKYYVNVSPYLLRHLKDKPITMIRCPDGIDKHHFYQKNAPIPTPDWVTIVDVPSDGKTDVLHTVIVDSVATLLWLGNLGCIEIHIGFNPYQSPSSPEWLAFDLDPSVPGFERVVQVALSLHELLERLSLPNIAKTSGATGLQVFVPLAPGHTYAQTRVFSEAVAQYMQAVLPNDVTLERLTKERGQKVYFDYMQHGRGRTLIAPYSPRATRYGSVSTPVTWTELQQGAKPEDFTLQNVPHRLEQMGDLFGGDMGVGVDLQPTVRFLHRHGGFQA